MKINVKKKLIRNIWIYKHLFFVTFETDNKELHKIIKALNIKSRYKRIEYIYEEVCNQIDQYYSKCTLCDFQKGMCIAYRIKQRKDKNGCCHKCLHQSDTGCKTKNIACKLFLCSYSDYHEKKKLEAKDIDLLKILNKYQRYVAINDYFATKEQAIIDLYVGPIALLLRLIYRGISYIYKRKKYENMDYKQSKE